MGRQSVIIKALCVLTAIWAVVFGIRAYASSKKITAERVQAAIVESNFSDWSEHDTPPDAAEAKRRDGKLREIAELVNRLDFNEREKNRDNLSGDRLFDKLTAKEKSLFIDLTVAVSMNRFMEALDAMPAEERKRFVERGLAEIREGKTQQDMARAEELGEDVLDKISSEGMRAYFEKADTDTKLDLAPLMEAMNEVMQGLRGNEFGKRTGP
jgi:hypothetical protein